MSLRIKTSAAPHTAGFFERDLELPPEALEGIAREKQIVAFAGYFGMGKSPALENLTVCAIGGIPWCGRLVARRPVIVFDFESASAKYRIDIKNIAERLKVKTPIVPDELDIYLANADPVTECNTKTLLSVMGDPAERMGLIHEALERKPNALVIIDPMDMMFPEVDKMKGQQVVDLYLRLRGVMSEYPRSLFLLTFNLRKPHREARMPILISDPRGWLNEIAGNADIVNRCDVRLGIDTFQDEIRVVNGIRRGEEMHPILVRPVGEPDCLAGFEQCEPSEINLAVALTKTQQKYWALLPSEFGFEQIADKTVPRSSLSRLTRRAQSLGLLCDAEGLFVKLGGW
jgi:hypothetical protein